MEDREGEANKKINSSIHVVEKSSSSDIHLPEELIVEILLRLDLKDVVRFRHVSKSWYALINNNNNNNGCFMEKHVKRIESSANLSLIIKKYHGGIFGMNDKLYKVDLNDVLEVAYNAVKLDDHRPFELQDSGFDSIVSSCNGLVCLSNIDNCIAVWNPSIDTFHKLPPMPIQFGGGLVEIENYNSNIVYGFGYDRITDDYKVMGIVMTTRFGIEARAYSLKKGSWAKNSRYYTGKTLYDLKSGTFASISNGLYWIMKQKEVDSDNQCCLIGAFDLGVNNGYHEVQLPNYKPEKHFFYKSRTYPRSLGVLRGWLCFSSTNLHNSCDLWVMKESWTRLISFTNAFPNWRDMKIRPLAYSRSGDNILLVHDDYTRKLIWYDLKTKTTTNVEFKVDLPLGEVCMHQEATSGKEEI